MKKVYSYLTLVSLVIGVLFGFFLPDFSVKIAFLGTWYINILKILIGPIIFASIAVSIANHKKGDSKIIIKTIILFIIMFVTTFLLSSLIITIVKPGANFVYEESTEFDKQANFNILAILKNLLPSSVKSFFMGGNIFFVILLSFIISIIFCLTKAKNVYGKVMGFAKKYLDLIVKYFIYVTPIAVIALVSNLIVTFGQNMLTAGIIYVVMAYVLSILCLIVVMILPVWLIAKVNPFEYIKKVSKVWLITLSTCSSVATLPHTIKTCNEDFGVDENITNIVVPLGCTIHMCGGAVSFSLLGLFVAQMSGISVGIGMYLLMVLFATLINMAAPGIPGGGVVIGLSYLSILGLPINNFYGFYAGAYKLLDMPYTTLNVTGDISANILLNHKKENINCEN